VDFTELLKRLKLPGAVDEHTLRLYHLVPGNKAEEPVRFTALPQARAPKRELLPGTSPKRSYPNSSTPGGKSNVTLTSPRSILGLLGLRCLARRSAATTALTVTAAA
jgi:hypothetical protein